MRPSRRAWHLPPPGSTRQNCVLRPGAPTATKLEPETGPGPLRSGGVPASPPSTMSTRQSRSAQGAQPHSAAPACL